MFCDSGYVILNSLKNALAARMKVSVVAMSVALATGLYATHTFVPPTPGPIAAAGNLGLESSLGLVILVGLVVSFVTAMAGMLWANRFTRYLIEAEWSSTSTLPARGPWVDVELGRRALVADGLRWVVLHRRFYTEERFARVAALLDALAEPVHVKGGRLCIVRGQLEPTRAEGGRHKRDQVREAIRKQGDSLAEARFGDGSQWAASRDRQGGKKSLM